MIRISRGKNVISFLVKPFSIALLLVCMFSLVWLRSHVVQVEYKLSELEKKKEMCLKERRLLFAEKASLLSFERVEASLRKDHRFVFPKKVNVIHMKKEKGSLPYQTSLRKKQVAEP